MPGAVSLAMTAFGKLALSRQNELVPSLLGLPLALLLCLLIGCYFARGAASTGALIGQAVLWTLGLGVLNLAIAIGGCAAMQPYFSVH